MNADSEGHYSRLSAPSRKHFPSAVTAARDRICASMNTTKAKERKERFATSSGIELKNHFTPPDAELDYERDLGDPGQYPFARGVYETMYRGRLWTMRQYAGFSTAAESNRRYKYLLEQGTTGLSVAFDLPTQIGYDSDHQLAAGEEIGRAS